MVREPLINPDPPIPAIALPTINILEEFASAHIKLPRAKIAMKAI